MFGWLVGMANVSTKFVSYSSGLLAGSIGIVWTGSIARRMPFFKTGVATIGTIGSIGIGLATKEAVRRQMENL